MLADWMSNYITQFDTNICKYLQLIPFLIACNGRFELHQLHEYYYDMDS